MLKCVRNISGGEFFFRVCLRFERRSESIFFRSRVRVGVRLGGFRDFN